MKKELYIGVMSGTSADGIDAVIAEISNEQLSIIAHATTPLADSIRQEIKALSVRGHDEIERAADLGIRLSLITSELINKLLKSTHITASRIRAIGYHGQTIRHQPNAKHPFSIQIGCPSTLSFRTQITTITDFRMADIAAGGQGAPLVPAFHQFAFQTPTESRFIVNIGGMANITFLPCDDQEEIIGFDTGPGNTLLDEWITQHKGLPFDEYGSWASSGKVIPELLTSMMQDDYILKSLPKSTGKEHFNLAWLARHTNTLDQTKAEDVQRTLLEFTACSIATCIRQLIQVNDIDNAHIYICGGGINNSALLQSLQNQLPGAGISSTEQLSIHPQLVECSAFAWLAHQTMQSKPGNLPSVTGASQKRILGGIYLS